MSRIFGKPNNFPIKLKIKRDETSTTSPITPFVIFFLAPSRACLSPLEEMILTAPVTIINTIQIIPIIVIRPTAEERNVAKTDIPL